MADLEFETRLERMFAEPPMLPGGDAFAALIESRLERGWTLRNILIGALGIVGGVIGVGQMVASHVVGHVESLSSESAKAATGDMARLIPDHFPLSQVPFGSEALWMSAALAAVAIGFAITRAVEEF